MSEEKWKADLDARLKREKQEIQLRVAATELALGVLSQELQQMSAEARGRMDRTISAQILTSGGLFGPQIQTQARKLLNL